MKIDKDIIQGKIDIIERDLRFLNDYKTLAKKEFLKSFKDIQAAKYSLLEVIEACIDIAAHIISIQGFERPKTYAEIFELLGKKKIINISLSRALANMARFRNLLVHSYAKVDNLKVLNYIKNDLDNIKEFIQELMNFL